MSRWLALDIGGQRWSVFLVSGKSNYLKHPVDGERLDGKAHFGMCRIHINKDLADSALEDVLLHELLHATFSVTGIQHTLEEACKAGKAYATEEQIILSLTPVLHKLLKDLGLVFPKRD